MCFVACCTVHRFLPVHCYLNLYFLLHKQPIALLKRELCERGQNLGPGLPELAPGAHAGLGILSALFHAMTQETERPSHLDVFPLPRTD
jgi:hypothetical protein